MTNPQILEYLKFQFNKGISADIVKKNLLVAGFSELDINQAFASIASENLQQTPAPTQNENNLPKVPEPTIIEQEQPVPQPTQSTVQPSQDTIQAVPPNTVAPQKPVVPVMQSMPSVNEEVAQDFLVKPNTSHKKFSALYIGLAVLVVVVGIATAFYFVGSKLEKMDPTLAYTEAKANMFSLSAFNNTYSLNMSGETKGYQYGLPSTQGDSKKYPFSVNLNLNFSYDAFDINNLKSHINLDFKIVSEDESMGNSSLAVESIYLNKVLYIKLIEAPDLGFFDLKPFENQWIKFDTQSETSPAYLAENSEQDKKIKKEKEQIKQLIINHNIIDITKNLGTEKIDGVTSYHYGFVLDKKDIKSLFVDLQNIGKEDYPESAEYQKAYTDRINKEIDDLNIKNGEIWISQGSLLIKRIKFDVLYNSASTSVFKINKVTIDTNYTNFNKKLKLEAPQGTKDIEKVIEEIFGSSLIESRGKGSNAAIKANLSNIRVQAELFYDQNHGYGKKFNLAECPKSTSSVPGTLFEDKFVFGMLSSAVSSSGSDYVGTRCFASSESYAISVPLKIVEGVYTNWCIDNTGNSMGRTTPLPPSATNCTQ